MTGSRPMNSGMRPYLRRSSGWIRARRSPTRRSSRLLISAPKPMPERPTRVLDDLVQPHEGAAADEEHVGGVDLDELLVRVLAAALGRHVGDRALQDLQQGLLHALARHVARDGGVLGLAGDLVDLVDVDDAALGPLDVVVRRLQEAQDDVLDVLAHVARLGEGGGIGDGEGHPEELGQGLGQEGLARAGGADQEDVGLLQLDVAGVARPTRCACSGCARRRRGSSWRAPGRSTYWSRPVLISAGLGRLRISRRLLLFPLLGDDVVAELDALVADVHGGPGDELADVVLALAAERALERAVGLTRPRHAAPPPPVRPTATCAEPAPPASVTGRVVGFEEMTSSTIL